MKEFDLNSIIRVKLTEEGINLVNERYSQMGVYLQPDEEGYFLLAMWQFMNIFGKYMQSGQNVLQDCVILINERDLTTHKGKKLGMKKGKQI